MCEGPGHCPGAWGQWAVIVQGGGMGKIDEGGWATIRICSKKHV
jgi:hypothetical protein